jgi:hypothetical protein
MPGLVGYYKNVWTPKMNLTLASDPRLAAGRAKIDVAANGRATAALALNPNRQVKRVTPPMVKKDGASLDIDKLMTKIEADFVTDKGHPDVAKLNGRTILYKSADLELSQADRDDFEKKRSAIRSALKNALAGDNFPPEIESAEIQTLIKTITAAVKAHSGDDLKTALNNRAANWVKDAKTAYVDRAIEKRNVLTPQDLAEAIAYRAEARARAAGADVDLDPETEVKSSKQKDLIKGLAKTLSDPANADKLKKPAKLIDDISATLSNPAAQAVYMKAGATTHVSVDVKKAKSAWLLKLATM